MKMTILFDNAGLSPECMSIYKNIPMEQHFKGNLAFMPDQIEGILSNIIVKIVLKIIHLNCKGTCQTFLGKDNDAGCLEGGNCYQD